MAEIALEKNDNKTAKSYLLNSLKIINESALNDQQTILSIYESLSNVNEKEGNFAEALRYYKMYISTYKSIYDQEKIQFSKRLEAQFEKERHQQQMVRLQLESEKKEQQIQLMHSLGVLQKQELTNTKLSEEFQRKKLILSQLESDKRAQELTISKQDLKLSQLENKSRNLDLVHYIKELNYKNKINKYYIILIVFFNPSVTL